MSECTNKDDNRTAELVPVKKRGLYLACVTFFICKSCDVQRYCCNVTLTCSQALSFHMCSTLSCFPLMPHGDGVYGLQCMDICNPTPLDADTVKYLQRSFLRRSAPLLLSGVAYLAQGHSESGGDSEEDRLCWCCPLHHWGHTIVSFPRLNLVLC